jgi:hypothetical protein
MVRPRRRNLESRAGNAVTLHFHVRIPRLCIPAIAGIAAVTLALGVTACGAGQGKNGVVYGTLYGSGGPLVHPKHGTSSPNSRYRIKDVTVSARRDTSGRKFETVTSRNGSYSLNVPPGTYVLQAACGKANPPTVQVPSGGKVKRNIQCVFG